MSLIKIITISALLCTLIGCASIAGNNTRSINVSSNPQGAEIYLDGHQYGVTPSVVTLPTYIYGGKTLTVVKKGYQTQSLNINTQFQPIALLDILVWPTFLVDAVAGNLVKIDPVNLNAYVKLGKN